MLKLGKKPNAKPGLNLSVNPNKKPAIVKDDSRTCEHCGEKFYNDEELSEGRWNRRIYCGSECRIKATIAKRAKHDPRFTIDAEDAIFCDKVAAQIGCSRYDVVRKFIKIMGKLIRKGSITTEYLQKTATSEQPRKVHRKDA